MWFFTWGPRIEYLLQVPALAQSGLAFTCLVFNFSQLLSFNFNFMQYIEGMLYMNIQILNSNQSYCITEAYGSFQGEVEATYKSVQTTKNSSKSIALAYVLILVIIIRSFQVVSSSRRRCVTFCRLHATVSNRIKRATQKKELMDFFLSCFTTASTLGSGKKKVWLVQMRYNGRSLSLRNIRS